MKKYKNIFQMCGRDSSGRFTGVAIWVNKLVIRLCY